MFKQRMLFVILLCIFAAGCANKVRASDDLMTQGESEKLHTILNHHVWLLIEGGNAIGCRQAILNRALFSDVKLVKQGFDQYSISSDDVVMALQKGYAENFESFLKPHCFDSPMSPRSFGVNSIDELVQIYFYEEKPGVWLFRKHANELPPLPMIPSLYAAFIQAKYHVGFSDLIPIIYLVHKNKDDAF